VLAAAIREEMTTPLEKLLQLRVPLRVDIATGPNWLDLDNKM
jgi:DNA polymerase I-like protein with 3'-5' exonuclease and polymerase domains